MMTGVSGRAAWGARVQPVSAREGRRRGGSGAETEEGKGRGGGRREEEEGEERERGEEEWWEQTGREERKEERGRLDGAHDLPLEGGRPLVKLVRREVARPRVEDLDHLANDLS